MKMNTPATRQAVMAGTCVGTINTSDVYEAGLVTLYEYTYPPLHNAAYVMLARQRTTPPPHTTKEIMLSFSKTQPNGTYDVTPDTHIVRITFADFSDPVKPVIYTQRGGKAELAYDVTTGVFSGKLTSVVVENHDDDVPKTLTLDMTFSAYKNTAMPSRSRTRSVAA